MPTRSIPQASPAPIREFSSQITSNTSNKLRPAIQTKSTSEKGAVMCLGAAQIRGGVYHLRRAAAGRLFWMDTNLIPAPGPEPDLGLE